MFRTPRVSLEVDISVSFEEISNSLLMNKQQVQLLTQNNKSLSSDVDNLTEILKDKNEEIDNLKEENSSLKSSLQHLKDMFYRLIHFLKDKILRSKDKEKYKEFAKELYEHGAIDDENMKSIRDISVDNKNKNYKDYNKEKDDFER